MAMHIVARGYIYGETPDMDPMGEAPEELIQMMEALYWSHIDSGMEERGLTLFPDTCEVGAEGGTDMDPEDIRELFESLRSEAFEWIWSMDEDQIRSAYKET